MMDAFHKLVFAASIRRALATEAWLRLHELHYPGAHLETMLANPFTQIGRCSCGAVCEFTVCVSMEARELPK